MGLLKVVVDQDTHMAVATTSSVNRVSFTPAQKASNLKVGSSH